MIKFRNPVSDINVIINVFKLLYLEFSDVEYFDLDNIAEFFAREKLASSSGYTGNEALKRSYQISDDSRKSMKMQAKSYAEFYRFLGWIYSTDEKALNFSFSYLGINVAISGNTAKNLFEQCLLGICYPNNILNVKFNDINKPFISILWFAKKLNGIISRDEILIGPMNLIDSSSEKEKNEKLTTIKKLRNSSDIKVLNSFMQKLSDENDMLLNSVRNLTRFVISSITYVSWFEKCKLNMYGKPKMDFLKLTKKGLETLNLIENSLDIHGIKVKEIDIDEKSLVNYGFLTMLQKSGFDVNDDISEYNGIKNEIKSKYNKDYLLFSPYQYYSKDELYTIDSSMIVTENKENYSKSIIESIENQYNHLNQKSHLIYNKISNNSIIENSVKQNIINLKKDSDMEKFYTKCISTKQTDFYPLVAYLLGIIFNKPAFTPQAGNNNLRFDVVIPDENYSIPVEVKSPTEEIMLSVKSIRQALENKIILLSRKSFETTYNMTSLVIGYNIPNERSDVYKLIENIFNTYKINISIIDFKTLLFTAKYCSDNGVNFNITDFENAKGVITFNYENI